MALPPLATLEELAAYTQTSIEPEAGNLALRLASGKVRAVINRPDLPQLVDADSAPDDIRAVVLAIAARVVGNPGDLRQETVGAISLTYATETVGAQLTDIDRDALRRYRINARTIEVRC